MKKEYRITNSREFITYWNNKYLEVYGEQYVSYRKDENKMIEENLLNKYDPEMLKNIIDVCIENYVTKWGNKNYPRPTIGAFCIWIANRCVTFIKQQQNQNKTQTHKKEKYNGDEEFYRFMVLIDRVLDEYRYSQYLD